MKRCLLAFVLILSITPGIFSQNSQNKNHTIFIDFFPMVNGIFSGGVGLGTGYEHTIGQYFAVGGYINFYTNFDKSITYNIVVDGKFYPLKTKAGNLFIDTGLGYRRRQTDDDNIHCLVGLAHTGWRFIFKNGLVLEPGIGLRYDIIPFSGSEAYRFGYNIRGIIGWTF
jgi:hypothetical protein